MITLRFILSLVQFLWLAHLPLLMPPLLASCFVLLLRIGLLATPFWTRITGTNALVYTIVGIGLFSILTLLPQTLWLGAIGVSLLLSTAAFLIRQSTSKAVSSASWNKIALHAGSLSAGVIAIYSIENIPYFYYSLVAGVLISLMVSLRISNQSSGIQGRQDKSWRAQTPSISTFWFMTGIVMGFRSYAPYVVLPAMLIREFNKLPSTFGTWMMIYSLLVILWQVPSSRGFRTSLQVCFKFLIIGTVTISGLTIPGVMLSKTLIWLWLFLISSQELFAASLDVEASKEKGLFLKEIGVGIGGGLGVLLVQFDLGSLYITLVGLSCLMIGGGLRLRARIQGRWNALSNS